MFEKDSQQLNQIGLSPEKLKQDLEFLKEGFPFPTLVRPCTLGDGIVKLSESEAKQFEKTFQTPQEQGCVMKFVPASGAATRMFKELLLDLEEERVEGEGIKKFIQNLRNFAFYPDLGEACEKQGTSLKTLVREGQFFEVTKRLLYSENGLGYAELPKGLVLFHDYPDGARSAFEEHLVEGIFFLADERKNISIHFTIPEEYQSEIESHLKKTQNKLSQKGFNFSLTYSTQKKSTNTLAVDENNHPFRNEDGSLHLRPGGHGALIDNLNELDGDIVFIKNIDNLVPEHSQSVVAFYKRVLGGYLVSVQEEMFSIIRMLKSSGSGEGVERGFEFVENKLNIETSEVVKKGSIETQVNYLLDKLNRPLRVCGMVPNDGEPGGGPFWVKNRDDEGVSLQIIESSQVNFEDENQKKIWESSTHFNPVDLVCGLKDYEGNSFDLKNFVDPKTGFITKKSKDGKPLKALELPGLWNGAMAYWNTFFIEVPIETFNPVKTVMDLLRPSHQPKS